MAGPYFKEWRKHRGYTQDQVVDRLAELDDPNLPATGASLSRLENGKQPYSQRIVEALILAVSSILDRPSRTWDQRTLKSAAHL